MVFLTSRNAWISPLALLVTLLMIPDQVGAQMMQPQPRTANQQALSNSVILKGGSHAATIQRLHVVRQYAFSTLRANSQVALGEAHLDFRPMLNNPRALINVAQRLHAMAQHVQIQEEASDITEVDQGLVIHQVLSYRILPGKCADAAAVSQLASAGVECFARTTPNERALEFSTKGNPHYVGDPAKRQAAIAANQRQSALVDADATKRIADLHKALADPTQRAAIAAQFGQAELARLNTLSDDQLKDEVINAATQRFEETAFVPRLESGNYAHPKEPLRIEPAADEMTAGKQLLNGDVQQAGTIQSRFPHLLSVIPATRFRNTGAAANAGGDQVTDLDLGTYYYLTGFTLGHDYEWNLGVSTTINWCVIGCSSTYDVNLYAGFNYGFGLRFPIQTQLTYHNVVHPNNSADATLKAVFEPIQGNVQDFQATGLSNDQLFNGQELVAQVGANAGFNFNLPVIGSGGDGFQVGVDFTQWLPSPYTGGSFPPPAPSTSGITTPYILDQIDMLGGLLNFGALGGQVFPAVDINLHSNKLQFTLNDELARRQTTLKASGQTVNVSVSPTGNHDSHFSVGNPVYNLGFTLTPGVDARVFLDLAVWSHNWDWPVWFPQLAVDLPPNGIDFGCHAGTTCVLDFLPEQQAAMTSGLVARLESEGCTHRGSSMACFNMRGYNDCLAALNAKPRPLDVQSCDPGMALKAEDSADRTLTGGGCQRNNGRIGEYVCPMEQGMLGLCQTMLKNGAILSCGLLVPSSTDQILKRGGCTAGQPGNYACPSSMIGLCQLYVKNRVILACSQK